jgi:hypothetical protein
VTDPNDVAAVRDTLAEWLHETAKHPAIAGTSKPLQDAAAYVTALPTDHGPLADLTASVTRPGDGLDPFDLGPGWQLSHFDPRTTSVEQLILAIIEANLEDELDDDQEDQP